MININELTLGQIKEIQSIGVTSIPTDDHPWNIGKNYFIRTVTFHLTGTLMQVGSQELVLQNAAWIADSGRFTQAVEKSEFSEVEVFPKGSRVIVGRGSIVDAVEISTIQSSQK